MRATTTKRRMADGGLERLVAKQARRERLAFRLVERRLRWQSKQARTTAQLGGA